MKYNLHINQKQAIELGIKNFNQAHIFDLISMCSTWAKPVNVDGEIYYWVARQVIIKELPLMDIKADTAYRHLKKLVELELIEHIKDGVKDLVRLTDLGKTYHSDTMSEINPSKVGNKSENNSEINPTYHTTKLHHTTIQSEGDEKEISFPESINIKAWDKWIDYRFEIKKKYKTTTGMQTAINKLSQIPFDNQMQCIDNSIQNEYQGFFTEKYTGQNNGTNKNYNKPQSAGERANQAIRELLA